MEPTPLYESHYGRQGDLYHLILNGEADEQIRPDMLATLEIILPVLQTAQERFPGLFAELVHFDINPGFNAPPPSKTGVHPEEISITPQQMRQISDLGATWTVTIYPSDEDESEAPAA
ncbi:MAG: hypothetical protein AAGK14_07880 [Verrucomicrobiota bacterium]